MVSPRPVSFHRLRCDVSCCGKPGLLVLPPLLWNIVVAMSRGRISEVNHPSVSRGPLGQADRSFCARRTFRRKRRPDDALARISTLSKKMTCAIMEIALDPRQFTRYESSVNAARLRQRYRRVRLGPR
jgi:hypothetical protein